MSARPQLGFIAPALCALLSACFALLTLNQATRYGATQAQRWLSERLATQPIQGLEDLNITLSDATLELKLIALEHTEKPLSASYLSPLKGFTVDTDARGTLNLAPAEISKEWFDAYWSPRAQWARSEGLWLRRPLTPKEREALGRTGSSELSLIAHLAPPTRAPLPWLEVMIGALSALLGVYGLRRWAYGRLAGGALIGLWGSVCVSWPLLKSVSDLQQVVSGWALTLNVPPPTLIPSDLLVPLSASLPWLLLAIAHLFTRGRPSPNRVAYTYMAPTLISVSLLVFVPFALGVALAFTRHDHGRFEWVGLEHFYHILGGGLYELTHPLNFYFTLGVTVLWTALNVLLHTSLGLSLALLLNRQGLAFKGLYRALLIIPWAIPNYITALIWKGMFHQQYGLINHSLGLLGLTPVPWMSSFWGSMTANVTTNTWLGFPFMMVVCLGALQSVPRDLYEAADLAGASPWVKFRHITLPLLIPALTPAIILGSVWTFNMFNIIYLVSGGQPNGATDILITEAYRWAFEQDRYGYAAAYSLVIFVILILYARLTQRLSKAAEEVYA